MDAYNRFGMSQARKKELAKRESTYAWQQGRECVTDWQTHCALIWSERQRGSLPIAAIFFWSLIQTPVFSVVIAFTPNSAQAAMMDFSRYDT